MRSSDAKKWVDYINKTKPPQKKREDEGWTEANIG